MTVRIAEKFKNFSPFATEKLHLKGNLLYSKSPYKVRFRCQGNHQTFIDLAESRHSTPRNFTKAVLPDTETYFN